MSSGSPWAIMELGCWIVGIALVLTYLATTAGLENQRKQGIELFAQARAAITVSHGPQDPPLAGRVTSLQNGQTDTTVPAPASGADMQSLPIAVLRIDRVALEVPVYSNLSELNLSRGAGWIEGTSAPDAGGNMAIAAHRDRYFRSLKDVQIGDTVNLENLSGHGEFRVSRILIVDPEDVWVLDDTSVPTLTLVTCYPFYFIGNAPQRYIVQAIAVDQSGKVSASDAISTGLPSGETP